MKNFNDELVPRIIKFKPVLDSLFTERSLRYSLINFDEELKDIYQRVKRIVDNFDEKLFKSFNFELENYKKFEEYENDQFDATDLDIMQQDAANLFLGINKKDFNNIFDDQFLNYQFFKTIIAWDENPVRSNITKVNLGEQNEAD